MPASDSIAVALALVLGGVCACHQAAPAAPSRGLGAPAVASLAGDADGRPRPLCARAFGRTRDLARAVFGDLSVWQGALSGPLADASLDNPEAAEAALVGEGGRAPRSGLVFAATAVGPRDEAAAMVLGRSLDGLAALPLALEEGSWSDLGEDGVALTRDAAERLGVGRGEPVILEWSLPADRDTRPVLVRERLRVAVVAAPLALADNAPVLVFATAKRVALAFGVAPRRVHFVGVELARSVAEGDPAYVAEIAWRVGEAAPLGEEWGVRRLADLAFDMLRDGDVAEAFCRAGGPVGARERSESSPAASADEPPRSP